MTLVATAYDRHGKIANRFETARPFYLELWPLNVRQGGRLEFTHGNDDPPFVPTSGFDQSIFN